MQPLMQPGAATATTATTATTTTTTKHITSSDNNNLNLAIMHRTTKATTTPTTRTTSTATTTMGTIRKTNLNSKFHKRRRRRQRSLQRSSRIATTPTATLRRYTYPNLSRTSAYLTLLLLTTTCSLCASVSVSASNSNSGSGSGSATSAVNSRSSSAAGVGETLHLSSPCASDHWWNQSEGKCTPCTLCQGEMMPLRPCLPHVDTHCGSIYDLKIDWFRLAQTERNWRERRKSSDYEHFDQNRALQHLTHEQLQQLHEEAAAALPLDWQTGALFIAVLVCLLFFSVAACILIHHMRQWRRMERRLDQDVEELSTKLMAKLAEVHSLDGGTFFIGNADALRGLPAAAVTSASAAQSGIFQPQHVLLPAEKHGKHQQERRILKTLQPGNVYIEENNAIGVGIMSNFKG